MFNPETDIRWIDHDVPSGLYEIPCPWWESVWVGECYVCPYFGGEDKDNLYCMYPRSLKKSEMRVEEVECYDYGELPELINTPTMFEYFKKYCSAPRSKDEIRGKCCLGKVDFNNLVLNGCLHLQSEVNGDKFYIFNDRKEESQTE